MTTKSNQLTKIPYHVGIIMDGNGRWAQARGLPRIVGHRAGTENLRRILRACVEFGIKILTIYAFSTENWNRPLNEVRGLMLILEQVIDRELADLNKNGVQIRHIGRIEGISERLRKRIRKAVETTKDNDSLILNVAFNYGGRAEILDAARSLLRKGVSPDTLTEEMFANHLYTAGLPDPDLIIRTGGDMRLSNFMIWQAAYAEIYSTPTFWPDFDQEELRKALLDYASRERRFGRVLQTPSA